MIRCCASNSGNIAHRHPAAGRRVFGTTLSLTLTAMFATARTMSPFTSLSRNILASSRICRTFPARHTTPTRILSASRVFSSSDSRFFSRSSPSHEPQRKYLRFGSGVNHQRPWDISKWHMPTKIAVGVALAGGVYYITQCVSLLIYCCCADSLTSISLNSLFMTCNMHSLIIEL